MDRSPRSTENIPCPTTPEEIASICNFKLITNNEISSTLREEQEASARTWYKLQNGNGPPCGCEVRNGKCCSNNSCRNKCAGISCGDNSCSFQCQNRQWIGKKFAVDKDKVCLRWTEETGFGLYACQIIEKHEQIGEYCGVVYPKGTALSPHRNSYAFELPFVGHVIDGSEKGSALRILNHGCVPSCVAFVYVSNGLYKVVVEALDTINPGNPLTIDYNWWFDRTEDIPHCRCGHELCKGRIGNLRDATSECQRRLVLLFWDFTFAASAAVQALLNRPVLPREYDATHQENHMHSQFEEVAVIIQQDGNLVISLGRVLQGYINTNGLLLYIVRIIAQSIQEYHLPRWMVFRHREMATFRLTKVFTDEERTRMLNHLLTQQTWKAAEYVTKQDFPDYTKRFYNNNMPEVMQQDRHLEGAAALGISDVLLVEKIMESCHFTDSRALGQMKQPFVKQNFTLVPTVTQSVKAKATFTGVTVQQVEPPDNRYSANIKRPIMDIKNDNRTNAMLQRVLYHAIENVSKFLKWNLPSSLPLTYHESYKLVSQELRYYYLKAEPGKSRKFLLYPHYKIACEVEAKGSIAVMWCSLCKTSHTFDTEDSFQNHFCQFHMMVSPVYVCHKCNERTNFPSVYRSHIAHCMNDLIPFVRMDVYPYMIDAFANYAALCSKEGTNLQLLRPGLPDMKHNTKLAETTRSASEVETDTEKNQCHLHEHGSSIIRTQMNPSTNKPCDSCIKIKPKSFKIQKRYSKLKPGAKLISKQHVLYSSNLETNKWTYQVSTGHSKQVQTLESKSPFCEGGVTASSTYTDDANESEDQFNECQDSENEACMTEPEDTYDTDCD